MILTGTLVKFPTIPPNGCNSRIYPKGIFDKYVREYELKVLQMQRKEKLKKINGEK